MARQAEQRFGSLFWQAFIKACGYASSVLVLIIVLFLFSEGMGLFSSPAIDRELVAAVHPDNPITEIDEETLHALLGEEITTWADFRSAKVELVNVNNLEKKLKAYGLQGRPEDVLGQNFERLPLLLDSMLTVHPGMLIILQPHFVPQRAKQVNVGHISLGRFLAGRTWDPTRSPSPLFGALPLLWGTILVTLGALFFALLLGPPVAMYMAELAPKPIYRWLKPTVELLAGIPSVVFGFIGLVVLVPNIQVVFGLDSGSTVLAGCMLLAVIALPTIISVSEDAIRAVPRTLKEASLGMGATHWQTMIRVIVPYSAPGILAAILLGVGRIVGETMAVLMVTGNTPQMVGFDFLASVRTMSAAIAAEMGEAPQGGLHYKSLFAVGCLLFLLTFIINLVGELLVAKKIKQR
ncbi:MAG: phosphate ABC transporter permease subunit PstC [Bacteroidetes bacterium]|nr:phosphate ABC transporter permease subunit PstC [Bacteroidota bacterium]